MSFCIYTGRIVINYILCFCSQSPWLDPGYCSFASPTTFDSLLYVVRLHLLFRQVGLPTERTSPPPACLYRRDMR